MKRIFATFLSMLVFDMIWAYQSDNYAFTHVTVDNGLSNNWVEDICQDKYGRMWFATNDGLNCYDSYDCIIYKHDSDNPHTVQSNIINSIFLDWDEDLWACTANGLARLDYEKGVFCRISLSDEVHSVENITQIDAGLYLVGTRTETYFYDKVSGRSWECLLDGEKIAFYSIIVDDGKIVAGSVQGKELLYLSYEGGELKSKMPPVKMHFTISSILKADNTSYWVGKGRGGLYLVDIMTGAVSKKGEFLSDDLSVDSMTYDATGRLWVGTANGLYVMEPTSRSVLKFDSDNDPMSLSHDAIKSLFCDKSGGVWIGTEFGGVNYWSGKRSKFCPLAFSTQPTDKIVTSLCLDKNGSFWIGTRNGGLHHYSVAHGRQGVYEIENIRSVLPTENVVYVGTRIAGWKIIDKKTGKYTSFDIPSDVNDFLMLDNGNLLVGGLSGLYIYDSAVGEPKKLKPAAVGEALRVLTLFRDSNNIIWVGAKEGVRKFLVDGDGTLEELDSQVFSDIIQVQCLHESDNSTMWLGTADGLYSYTPADDSVQLISDGTDLNKKMIKGIREDSKGNLWVSTDNGLTRYNPATGDIRTYYAGDGLQINQFTSSHCADIYGNFYFGGVGGVTCFDPHSVLDSYATCPPVITGLKLFNVDVKPGDETAILTKDISLTQSIVLGHDQNSITISFSCPDYASKGKNRFVYKMEGVDADWIDAGGSRKVTYSNLGEGKYRFVLSVSNSDGQWEEEKAVLDIKVKPIWYRTLLARIFYLFIGLAILIFLAYRQKKYFDIRNEKKIQQIGSQFEENVRRVRISLYVTDPYLLKPSEVEFINRLIGLVDLNIMNPQFSVEALASMMNMTRANLHLKVKAITGVSPVDLIRKIRVEAACKMIKEGEYTLAEIAERSGFNSVSYFTVTFKKITGCTPGEYSSKLSNKVDI